MMTKFIAKAKSFFNNALVKGALFLCVSALICKIIGVIYRIPLTNIVGAEGIGLYQLIFPIYSFLLVISSNGVPVAISKMVAQKLAEQDYKYIYFLKKVCFILFGLIGLILSLFLIALASQISFLQGNVSASLGYKCIAPSVFFVSLICVYRGLFQGLQNMKPTGASQIIEQIIKFGFGITLPIVFAYKGVVFQIAMATLAVTISEAIALVFLGIKAKINADYKRIFKTQYDGKLRAYFKPIAKDVMKSATPIMLSSCIIPTSVLIESFIIVNLLSPSTGVYLATEIYGVYSGVVAVLINAPIVLASSIGIALVPKASLEALTDKGERQTTFDNAVLFACIIAIPSALFFALCSNFIISVLFPSLHTNLITLASQILVCSAFNVITLSLSYILIYYLQSNTQVYKPVACLIVMNTARLLLCFILLSRFGIVAYVIAGSFIYLMQLLQLILIKKQIK